MSVVWSSFHQQIYIFCMWTSKQRKRHLKNICRHARLYHCQFNKNAGRIIVQHVLIVTYFQQVSFLSCKITVGVMYAGCSAKNACLWVATRCSCWGTFRAIKQETCWSSFHRQDTGTGFKISHQHFSSHSFKLLHYFHLIPHLIEKPKTVIDWRALLLRIYEVSYSHLGP